MTTKILRYGARLAAVLALSVVVALLRPLAAPAVAANGVCFLGADGTMTCPDDPKPDPTYAPPELVSPNLLPSFGPWAASVRRMETQAVDLTLAQHDLPQSDADAVRSWGRPEAVANLWYLVSQAIETPEARRTVDQQQVVHWMTGMVQGQAMATARATGEQYARWAGLSVSQYFHEVDSGAGPEELTDFFTTDAKPYRGTPGMPDTTGYCAYRSPAPYAEEYQGYQVQTCFTPCTSWVCEPPRPSYDNFARWGEAEATAGLRESGHIANAAVIASTLTQNRAVSGVATGLALTGALAGVYSALGPLAVSVITPGLAMVAVSSAVTVAAATVAVVLLVVGAVVGAVMAGMSFAEELATPAKLADLIVAARQAVYDLPAMLKTSDGATTLFSLFSETTLPVPRTDKSCDNTVIPVALYGSTAQDQVTIRDGMGHVVTVSTYPCLNPTAVPGPTAADPHFLVRSMATQRVRQIASFPLELAGRDGQPDRVYSLRTSGNWLVVTDADGVEHQALDVNFTDWDGRARTASISRTGSSGYTFRGVTEKGVAQGVDPDTCEADLTCWSGDLHYLGPDGQRYSAQLVGPNG